jgi:pyruvate dehydrogenase (quinone)
MGVRGLRVDDPERLDSVLDEAFSEPGPVLIDAVVDTDEPMFPPKRREPYMEHLQMAFDKGTPGQDAIKQRMQEEPVRSQLRS